MLPIKAPRITLSVAQKSISTTLAKKTNPENPNISPTIFLGNLRKEGRSFRMFVQYTTLGMNIVI